MTPWAPVAGLKRSVDHCCLADSFCPFWEDVKQRQGMYLAAGLCQFRQQIKALAEDVATVPSCYRHAMPGGHKCLGTSAGGPAEVTDDALSTGSRLEAQC